MVRRMTRLLRGVVTIALLAASAAPAGAQAQSAAGQPPLARVRAGHPGAGGADRRGTPALHEQPAERRPRRVVEHARPGPRGAGDGRCEGDDAGRRAAPARRQRRAHAGPAQAGGARVPDRGRQAWRHGLRRPRCGDRQVRQGARPASRHVDPGIRPGGASTPRGRGGSRSRGSTGRRPRSPRSSCSRSSFAMKPARRTSSTLRASTSSAPTTLRPRRRSAAHSRRLRREATA